MKLIKVDKIADVGCGIGNHAQLFRKSLENINIIGLDFSEAVIETIKQKNIFNEVFFCNSEKIPLSNKSVDIALSLENLEHLYYEEVINALEELKRISKYVIITTPEEEEVINIPWLTSEIMEAKNDKIPLSEKDFDTLSAAVHKSTIIQRSFIEAGFKKFNYNMEWGNRSHMWAKSEDIDLTKIIFTGINKKEIFDIINPTERYLYLLNKSLGLNNIIKKL